MTEFELFQALRPLYPPREYALLPQAANGTGAGAFRHCDALTLSLWPSRGMHLSGFEIKSYRGDWLRELRNPEKAEEIAQFCNYWWIVASAPFVKKDELPEPWGLMTWDQEKQVLRKTKAARFRKAKVPDLPFIAAMLRKAQEIVTPDSALAEVRKEGRAEGVKEAESRIKQRLKDLEELEERVRAFEVATGLEIDGWRPVEEIARAVKVVLDGTVGREQERLMGIATRILADLGRTPEAAS